MTEVMVCEDSLPEAYHEALSALYSLGELTPCPDYNTQQLECGMTICVKHPLQEPMISKLFFGSPESLEQYTQEMLDGILDFEIDKGNWEYTYHDRITNFHREERKNINQVQFVIDELKRNPYSRRAVISIRSADDMSIDCADPACFAAGTLIETPYGRKKVEEIKDGDEVYAYDFNSNTKVVAKAYNCFSKKSNCIAITTDFGSIVVSDNQLMYTTNGWKEAKDLTCDDKIFYNGYTNGEYNIYHLIGCLYGDGWLSTPNPKHHKDGSSNGVNKIIGFSVHPNADTSVIDRLFKSFTNNTLTYKSYFVKSETVPNGGISKKVESVDTTLYDMLSKYVPCGRKTDAEVKISAKTMSVPDIVSFLTGVYSCEGTISKRGKNGHAIVIGMNWHNCIDLIDEMLTILNIPHSTYKKGKTWRIFVQNYDGFFAFFNSGIDFRFDSRKQIKFENIKAQAQYEIMKRYGIKNITSLDTNIKENSMFVPVRTIRNCGETTVYDFTVDHKDHAIVANGFVAHNCMQHIQFFMRDNALHCKVLFRSNDAIEASFNNMYALIRLQERIANELGYEVGSYTHRANSFHCYAKDFSALEGCMNRIIDNNEELCYYYDSEDGWKPMMEEAKEEIKRKVEELYART